MIKLGHLKDVSLLADVLPKEVECVVESILTALDQEYGKNRHIDEQLGGYVLILNTQEDLNELDQHNLDKDNLIPEYVDKIAVNGGEDWTNSLILLSSDFSVSLIMPIRLLPECLLVEMA